MDVLPGALPEAFFLEASEKCLDLLGRLVSPGMCELLNTYLASPSADPRVVAIIHKHLDGPIRHATFHQELHNDGTVATLRNLNLDLVAGMKSKTELEKLIDCIDKFYDNIAYVKPRIEPRTKAEFEEFLGEVPAEFQPQVSANRSYFYTPHAKELITGLQSLIRRRQDIDIAYKGAKYRLDLLLKGRLGGYEEVQFT